MQTVQTRYLGPTDSRGARIKAFSEGFPRGVTTSYGYLSSTHEHARTALAFIKAREWYGLWVGGGAADRRGEVYVCLQPAYTPAQVRTCRKLFAALTFNPFDSSPDVDLEGARFCIASPSPILMYLPPEET